MPERTTTRIVTVVNPQGLHARPARLFVQLASNYESDVEVVKDGERVDGKSILSILTLAAGQGAELALQATGRDAEEAVRALAELVEHGFADEAAAEISEHPEDSGSRRSDAAEAESN